jgi:ABC-type spermidine/putrescine transport system permease subunit II
MVELIPIIFLLLIFLIIPIVVIVVITKKRTPKSEIEEKNMDLERRVEILEKEIENIKSK